MALSSGRPSKGQRAKQQYAIAMKDGAPFGVAGIWENWKEPASSEWIRTFAILTADANELVDDIHDRMTIILVTEAYTRSLSHEPAPPRFGAALAERMRTWPISTRVDKPENDDPSIVGPSNSQLMLPMQVLHARCSADDKGVAPIVGMARESKHAGIERTI
jgi:putative SOS response-associated peptidase YedK